MWKWLLMLLLFPIASASVQVDRNVTFVLNSTYINFSATQIYDNIDIGYSDFTFAGSPFGVAPTGIINVTIATWNITNDYRKVWNESSADPGVTTQHIMGGFPISKSIHVNKNAANWHSYISNSTGHVSFLYSDGYSDIQFDSFFGYCCYNLTGYVNNTLELPVQNARIDINGSHVFTDANGYYNFSGISEDTYLILTRAIGYRNNTNTTTISQDLIMNVTLRERMVGTVSVPGFSGFGAILVFGLLFFLRRK